MIRNDNEPILLKTEEEQTKYMFEMATLTKTAKAKGEKPPWKNKSEYRKWASHALMWNVGFITRKEKEQVLKVYKFWYENLKDTEMDMYFDHVRNMGDLYVRMGTIAAKWNEEKQEYVRPEWPQLQELMEIAEEWTIGPIRVGNEDYDWLYRQDRRVKDMKSFPWKIIIPCKLEIGPMYRFPFFQFTVVNVGAHLRSTGTIKWRSNEEDEKPREIVKNQYFEKLQISPEQEFSQSHKIGRQRPIMRISKWEEDYNEEDMQEIQIAREQWAISEGKTRQKVRYVARF